MTQENKPFQDAVAYSYIRFSSLGQGGGHSLKRQSGTAPGDWCKRNGANLSTKTYEDLGVSAYTAEDRVDPDRKGLRRFLNAIEEGAITKGSILLIENLDRLSRDHQRAAIRLVNRILDGGVHIVTLNPERVYRHDAGPDSQLIDAITMIVELNRGHQESARKSFLIGKAWEAKKQAARATGRPLTNRLPAWVKMVDEVRDERGRLIGGRLVLIPDRAATVRRIFELSAAGYGLACIVGRLTADGVATFGRSGKWVKSNVSNILKDRRAIGEYQPKRAKGKAADGNPIAGFFPAVPGVDQELWLRCRGGSEKRVNRPGRRAAGGLVNIFNGLLFNARESDTYVMQGRRIASRDRRDTGVRTPGLRHVLMNSNAVEGRSPAQSFPYLAFEAGILSKLTELDPREVMGKSPAADQVMTLAGELAGIEAELVGHLPHPWP